MFMGFNVRVENFNRERDREREREREFSPTNHWPCPKGF